MKKFIIVAAAYILLIAGVVWAESKTAETVLTRPAMPCGTFQPVEMANSLFALNTATGEVWHCDDRKWRKFAEAIPSGPSQK